MAKSDAFFIRVSVTSNGTTYNQEELDLGAYVNLGTKSAQLLRIHNIAPQIAASSGPEGNILATDTLKIGHQLTTQSQSALVFADDKSVVATGSMQLYNGLHSSDAAMNANAVYKTVFATQDFDVAPQNFSKGYLVGVDALFLGVDQSTAAGVDVKITYVLECTIESATQTNSIALSLSQS